MKKEDGGPAFPLDGRVIYGLNDPSGEFPAGSGSMKVEAQVGMSLRDYLAAAALTGIAAASWKRDQFWNHTHDVQHAYRYADAMLAERNK